MITVHVVWISIYSEILVSLNLTAKFPPISVVFGFHPQGCESQEAAAVSPGADQDCQDGDVGGVVVLHSYLISSGRLWAQGSPPEGVSRAPAAQGLLAVDRLCFRVGVWIAPQGNWTQCFWTGS